MTRAIEVAIIGNGSFAGRKSSLTSYSVDEAITPLDGSLGSAGVGTISFGAVESPNSVFLMDNQIELRDGARGIATGKVRGISSGGVALSVTADSILTYVNSTHRADPYVGTFLGAVTYYLSLVNIFGGFEVQEQIADFPVTLSGWRSNVLLEITKLCVAQQVEMSVVYDQIVFRAPRINKAVTKREKSRSFSMDRGSPALNVEAYCYQQEPIVDAVIYPTPLENPREGFQVDVNEQLEPTRIQLSASLTGINQPVPVNFVGPTYSGSTGTYVVLGNDNLPIPSAEWVARGGSLTVSIDPDDPNYMVINVRGMNLPNDNRAPYRVGVMSSGDGTFYPALYVTGTGVSETRRTLRVATGATTTEVEVGVLIDNRGITTPEQAYTAMEKAVLRFSGLNYTITGEAVSINRQGVGNEFATSLLEAFDAEFEGELLQSIDDRGWLFADFDLFFESLVIDQFENQLFGNAAGARIERDGTFFRVDSATTTQEGMSYTASIDTIMDDWDTAWFGGKLADWDNAWAGRLMRDWDVRPLRTELL